MVLEETRIKLGRLLGLWDYLVDPKVGVINEIYELPLDDDDPNLFHYLSRSCNTARFTPLKNFANNGGVSTDRYIGIAKAMGEAIERYCSAIFQYDDLILARYSDLKVPATAPESFALCKPAQIEAYHLRWDPFDADSLVAWTPGVSIASEGTVLVPAAMVFVPYQYRKSKGEAAITQPISTGLAAGCTFEEAALSGLCEVIERDAFTLMWQGRMSRPHIDPVTMPVSAQDLIGRFQDVSIGVKVMDITSDIGVPTVLTIALGNATTSPAVAVAAATDPSPEMALIKSLEELAHTRKFAKQLMEYTPAIPVEVDLAHPQVQDQRHHLRFYCPQESKKWIEFAWASRESRSFASLRDRSGMTSSEALRSMVAEIAEAEMDVIVCDLTTPDIASLGLSVVRVLVPGMNPLFMGYQNRALGGKRLSEVPQRLGYRQVGPHDNPYPHPFP